MLVNNMQNSDSSNRLLATPSIVVPPPESPIIPLNRTGPLHQKEVLALKKGLEEAIHNYQNLNNQEDEEERIAADLEKRTRNSGPVYHLSSRSATMTSVGLQMDSSGLNGGTSRHNNSSCRRIKILMLGDSGVGKSSLVLRWTLDTFSPSLVSTVGVNFKSKKITMRGQPVQVQVWDTAGQEHFHKITTSYYKGAHGIMLVYDVSDKKSAESVEYWVKNIRSHASDTVQLALIGNKIDLRIQSDSPVSLSPSPSPSENQKGSRVDSDYGKALSAKYGVSFFETSAKDSSNVNNAYTTLVDHILSSYSPPVGRRSTANFLHGTPPDSRHLLLRESKDLKDCRSKDRDRASSSIGSSSSSSLTSHTNMSLDDSSPAAKGLFSSLRNPEHRRHGSTSSSMGSLAASSGLPVNISGGGAQPCSTSPATEEKDKCSIS